MIWGILGALDDEIRLLLPQLDEQQTVRALGTEFHIGTIFGQQAVIACCGVGKVNAACCATYMIGVLKCTHLVHTGIAGALGHGLKTMDVVISRELCFHDQDAVMLKYFPARRFFDADPALITLSLQACGAAGIPESAVRVGRVATGDRFVNDRTTRDQIVQDCAPDCVEMEGAATAHAAFALGVPCVVIRTMSDCADDDTDVSYDDFLTRAANQSASIVVHMLRLGLPD